MKILVISLLRIGDLILQKPLLAGLRKKHPRAEITLLMNKQFSQVEPLLTEEVQRFLYFDRELLQKSCGENEFNILWGLQKVKNFVEDIQNEEFDVVYNFTHNKLSAHLSGLVKTRSRVGIYSENSQFKGLTNAWIQFFNSYFGRAEAAGFHYTELLAHSLNIELLEEKKPARNAKNLILIQPLTSDSKKNWGLEKFQLLSEELKQQLNGEVKILGAPFEKEILKTHFAETDLWICDFAQASEYLKEAALLITGDTSIKHVAALYGTPILELALGSSLPLQTGAYSNNSMILQPVVACGPCPHSKPCSQTQHRCGKTLSVEAVYQAAAKIYAGHTEWQAYSKDHPELLVFRTYIQALLGWTIECLSVSQKSSFDQLLQRKTMIVEELERRAHAQRTRKLPGDGLEAS